MSLAEHTAYQVYEKYHLGSLPNDVKDQIIILMLSNRDMTQSQKDQSEEEANFGMVAEDIPPRLTLDKLHSRIHLAQSQIDNGLARPIDEFFDKIDAKYPWLCK